MSKYLIMCRSLTWAQRASRYLERAGLTAVVVKAPQKLTVNGCGYAVMIRRRLEDAVRILRGGDIRFGKVYLLDDTGEYKEVRV